MLENRFAQTSTDNFSKIPGSPVAYWLCKQGFDAFVNNKSLNEISKPKTGMRTGDNDRFLRIWFEVPNGKLGFNMKNSVQAQDSKKKWFPYNKGGEGRLWYGNNSLVVNWEDDGYEIKENTRRVYPQLGDNLGWKITNEQDYFREGITWTALTSGRNTFRFSKSGCIFDSNKGPMLFTEEDTLMYLLGMLNSSVAVYFLSIINPTLSLQNGDLGNLPIINGSGIERVSGIVRLNIMLSEHDWDSYETSWDFKRNPLI